MGLGLAVIAAGLKVAKDRPNLTDEWVGSIEKLADFLIWPLLGMLVVILWIRIEINLLLDDELIVVFKHPLLILRSRISMVMDVLMVVLLVTFALFLMGILLHWFSRKWNAPFEMKLPAGGVGKHPGKQTEKRDGVEFAPGLFSGGVFGV